MDDAPMDWREDPDAPAPGARIGPAARFAADGVHFAEVGAFPLLLVRRGDELRAFWNLCPHRFLPLNWRGGSVLSADGATLLCTNHGARFSATDGAPLAGAAECGLSPVPVAVDGDDLVIGSAGAA